MSGQYLIQCCLNDKYTHGNKRKWNSNEPFFSFKKTYSYSMLPPVKWWRFALCSNCSGITMNTRDLPPWGWHIGVIRVPKISPGSIFFTIVDGHWLCCSVVCNMASHWTTINHKSIVPTRRRRPVCNGHKSMDDIIIQCLHFKRIAFP